MVANFSFDLEPHPLSSVANNSEAFIATNMEDSTIAATTSAPNNNQQQLATSPKLAQQQQQSSPIPGASSRPLSASSPAPATEGSPSSSPTSAPPGSDLLEIDGVEMDERLKRILACKRLSEGCLSRLQAAHFIQRKNSLHMIEELPALTEGEPMRHSSVSYHMSQSQMEQQNNNNSTSSSSTTSSSSRGLQLKGRAGGMEASSNLTKRGSSQDDNTASCSSSTSLDRSPTNSSSRRRRSSTVSQCSSVLSEGTRQQLNFDLSPDLPPETSLLEANAISPSELTDLELLAERPASPEPDQLATRSPPTDSMSSPNITDHQLLLSNRPISRMSTSGDGLECEFARFSPDSTLGDSNDQEMMASAPGAADNSAMARLTQCYGGGIIRRPSPVDNAAAAVHQDVEMTAADQQQATNYWQSETSSSRNSTQNSSNNNNKTDNKQSDDESKAVEQLIDNVSGVLVSETNNISETTIQTNHDAAISNSQQQQQQHQQSSKRQHYSCSAANSTCSTSSSTISAAAASSFGGSKPAVNNNKRSNTPNGKLATSTENTADDCADT